MHAPREVEVDLAHATRERVPIIGGAHGFTFGEPAVAAVGSRRLSGVIGWDPRLGWVLVLSDPQSLDEPGEPGGRGAATQPTG